ncbi:MAG: leucine-rich repeat domain-containing protein [Candidatus Thorarchaeota archaeon]
MSNKWGIKPEQAQVLMALEELIGRQIPKLEDLSALWIGVKIEDDMVKTLSLYDCKLTFIPEEIGNLYSLQKLFLIRNKLTNLPESLANLQSLQFLDLSENQFSVFPEPVTKLLSLQVLFMNDNQLVSLSNSIRQLKSLHALFLRQNRLRSLPESIGNLKSLESLNLNHNELKSIPNSLGNLTPLVELDLGSNQFTSLPDAITTLTSLKKLLIEENLLTSLPNTLWKLKNLETLFLWHNPWEGEWKEIADRDILTILDYCRQRASINVFLSHAVVDFEISHIKEISEYLQKQDEIYKVFYCEEDLAGNIDDFMDEKLPKCQLVLFFASNKSIYNSEDCKHELELARKHNIQILPIKGPDIDWKELKELNLSRELGYEFEQEDFVAFCQKLYDYILKLKREIHLFEPEQAKIDRERVNFKTSVNNYIDSEGFKEQFEEVWDQFAELFQDLSSGRINSVEYFSKCAQLLKENK